MTEPKTDGAAVKHTPGPWLIEATTTKGSVDVTVYAKTPIHKNPRFICRVYGEGILSRMTAERDANAALIARAPELLAENERLQAENKRLQAENKQLRAARAALEGGE